LSARALLPRLPSSLFTLLSAMPRRGQRGGYNAVHHRTARAGHNEGRAGQAEGEGMKRKPAVPLPKNERGAFCAEWKVAELALTGELAASFALQCRLKTI